MAVLAFVAASTGHAQNYPQKPVRFILPFAPGGGTDVVARLFADGLESSEATPQEFNAHLEREITKWIKLAKAARISIN